MENPQIRLRTTALNEFETFLNTSKVLKGFKAQASKITSKKIQREQISSNHLKSRSNCPRGNKKFPFTDQESS
jgi:hypothetical protein